MKKLILLAFMSVSLVFVTNCKKDDGGGNNNNNNNTNPPAEDFVTMNGRTFWGKNATSVLTKVSVDTFLSYRRVLGIEDTNIFVYHELRRAKSYKVEGISGGDSACVIQVNWGSDLGSPKVSLDGGSYKLERVNGKWVSTLSGGTGINSKTSNRIDNISFRLTWPN